MSLAPQIGSARIKKLLTQFETVEMICKASSKQLTLFQLNALQINHIKNPDQTTLTAIVKWAEQENHFIIPFTDSRYPPLLLETVGHPAILYIQGDITVLYQKQIAIVGSRNPTHTGLELATEFAGELTQHDFCITSGLAMGIDTASHTGALAQNGKTIAVLGSGLQFIYPKRNEALATIISQQGCLISELPLNTPPQAENFPKRNRIISGLSLGTLVIEAALRSGSLITAQFAAEQNRDVFAIPGSIRNPLSKGCLALIQQGAKCVTSVNDILIEFQSALFEKNSISKQGDVQSLDCTSQQVLACIDDNVTTIDQICARSKLSPQVVTSTLLPLELDGVVKVRFGGYTK